MPIGRKVFKYSSQAKRSTVRFYFGAGDFHFTCLAGEQEEGRGGGSLPLRRWWDGGRMSVVA